MFAVSGEMRFSAREYKPKGHLGSMMRVGSGIGTGGKPDLVGTPASTKPLGLIPCGEIREPFGGR